ncbi:MAG: hypothetical protein MZU91_03185 [Desulfosudis oleivorans]|nr:hypothetical protein [Desulfosudis oleivorans]
MAQANVDVIAAYPITPQTHIVEHLSEIVADGELDAEYVPVDSEHSAMSVCCGSVRRGRQDVHLHEFPGARPHERDLLHRRSHEAAHGHGAGQPVAFEPAVHLERPQRRHDGQGCRMDPYLRGERPGDV